MHQHVTQTDHHLEMHIDSGWGKKIYHQHLHTQIYSLVQQDTTNPSLTEYYSSQRECFLQICCIEFSFIVATGVYMIVPTHFIPPHTIATQTQRAAFTYRFIRMNVRKGTTVCGYTVFLF